MISWRASAEPALTANPSDRDLIILSNGDQLYGRLLQVSLTNAVRWENPSAASPIEFLPAAVSSIHLDFPAHPEAGSSNTCELRLINGDELTGQLVECDAQKITLETWFGGSWTVPRKDVQMLVPKPANQPIIYSGPDTANGWTFGKVDDSIGDAGQWHFHQGAFYARKKASIARNFNLPDSASIQFDLSWKGMFNLAIALYTDSLQPVNLATKENEPDFGGFYSLQITPGSANLLRVKKLEPLKFFDQAPVPLLGGNSTVHVEILVNKLRRSIALVMDDKMIREWVDTDFAGQGGALRFVHQGMGVVKVSHIVIRKWDGLFAEPPSNGSGAAQDMVKLRNGDRFVGAVGGIDHGQVIVLSDNNSLPIPINRVRQIEFAWKKSDLPSPDDNRIRAFFRGGGMLTLDLDRWVKDEVIGSSFAFGKIEINPAAFARIEFRPLASGDDSAPAPLIRRF